MKRIILKQKLSKKRFCEEVQELWKTKSGEYILKQFCQKEVSTSGE